MDLQNLDTARKTRTRDYPDHLKIKDALQLYFSKYHFVNGGYDLKWFRIKLGPVFIPLPNTKARVDAVKFHDIHHLLTEYPATLKGEAEIGGWEIASGCGKYYAAWVLNFGSLLYGVFFFRELFTTHSREEENAKPIFITGYDMIITC